MTDREDILRMADKAGVHTAHTEVTLMRGLARFAALVAAAEREACAKVCDGIAGQYRGWCCGHAAERSANAIRARSNA